MNYRRIAVALYVALVLLFLVVFSWKPISLCLRQIIVETLLHDGRNVLGVHVFGGNYVVQVRELVSWSERKAIFHVQGVIPSGSKVVATISGDFDPSSNGQDGVAVFLEAPGGYLDISVDYSSKTEEVPVFLVFQATK